MAYNKWNQETWERFIALWQSANSVAEVAEEFGIGHQHALNQACNARKKGVVLKKYTAAKYRKNALDWDKLKQVAKEGDYGKG